MANILCIYYSRTGRTEKLMSDIAAALDGELVRLEDAVQRQGLLGWLTCARQAMARRLPPVKEIVTNRPLGSYDLVIIGTPVWAGRCSAPVRSFLMQYGEKLPHVAYVLTRSCDLKYEEVYDQMDLYVRRKRVRAVSIRPNTVGSTFWREEFLSGLVEKEGDTHAG